MVRTADVVNSGLWKCFPAINCNRVEDILEFFEEE